MPIMPPMPRPVGADAFAAVAADALGGMRLELHPSVEIIRSPHPIVTIWAMNSGERALAPIDDWRGEDALVARPHLDVEVHVLALGGSQFLLALSAGRPLAEAAQLALAAARNSISPTTLAGVVRCGFVGRIVPPRHEWAAAGRSRSITRNGDTPARSIRRLIIRSAVPLIESRCRPSYFVSVCLAPSFGNNWRKHSTFSQLWILLVTQRNQRNRPLKAIGWA